MEQKIRQTPNPRPDPCKRMVEYLSQGVKPNSTDIGACGEAMLMDRFEQTGCTVSQTPGSRTPVDIYADCKGTRIAVQAKTSLHEAPRGLRSTDEAAVCRTAFERYAHAALGRVSRVAGSLPEVEVRLLNCAEPPRGA